MTFDWSRVVDWAGTALAIITLGGRQQYLKGKNAQKFYDFEKEVKDMKEQIERHETRLGDGGQAFARIDEKLSFMAESVKRIEEATNKTNDLFIQHMVEGQKDKK